MADYRKSSLEAIIFGCAGISMEVLFNAANDFIANGDLGFRGHSYAWMFPIWASAAPASKCIVPKLRKYNVAVRGMIYGAGIMLAEYALGTALRETIGKCPWSEVYHGAMLSINDIVRLDFYPLWCIAGLGVERLRKELNTV